MKALKCDICGEYYDYVQSSDWISKFAYLNCFNDVVGKIADICPECYKAIKKTLNDRKKLVIADPNDDDLK